MHALTPPRTGRLVDRGQCAGFFLMDGRFFFVSFKKRPHWPPDFFIKGWE